MAPYDIDSIKLDSSRRSREESVLLTLCIVGGAGVAPFALYRAIRGEWLAACVDGAIVAIVAVVFAYVWRTHKVRVPSIILTISYTSVVVAVNYITGPSLIFWAFPGMAAAYFLVRPSEGLAINVVALLALTPALIVGTSTLELAGLLITLTLNSAFAYLYSRFSLEHQRSLAKLATLDPLTGVGNRTKFVDDISKAISEKQRFDTSMCLIMLDLDRFKQINDRYGHLAGDAVLIRMTELCKDRLRGIDRLYRLGGEEFGVIASGVDVRGALFLAESLRQMVAEAPLLPDAPVTVSLGVAQCTADDNIESLFARADKALYLAKHQGRNRVCHEDDIVVDESPGSIVPFPLNSGH